MRAKPAIPGGRGAAACLLLALATTSPAPAQATSETATDLVAEASEAGVLDPGVRRWEYVVVLRTSDEVPDAFGRAQAAAFRAGGAVLEEVRTDWDGQSADWRLLVRTRREDAIHPVLREIRSQRGVLGATAIPLPETPTWPGGPGFIESYAAGVAPELSNAGRIVKRHDVPPVADARELLESAEVIAGPNLQAPNGMLDVPVGGFTLNVSEMIAKLKQSAWRRREDRMRNAELPILPSEPGQGTGDGSSGTP